MIVTPLFSHKVDLGWTFNDRVHIGYIFKKKRLDENRQVLILLAERQGFEPWVRYRTPDFESGTIDHSDTSPYLLFVASVAEKLLH